MLRGDVEGVAVPLKERFPFLELIEQRVVILACGGRRDIVPADFLDMVGVDARAQGAGDQLATQANTQHRQVALHGALDQLYLNRKVG